MSLLGIPDHKIAILTPNQGIGACYVNLSVVPQHLFFGWEIVIILKRNFPTLLNRPADYIRNQEDLAIVRLNAICGKYRYDAVDGFVEVPKLPGLGQDLAEEAISLMDKISIN